jgi:hypothetical protein
MGLRADIEEDLQETLEDGDDFGMVVELVTPDNVTQTHSANDLTELLRGQVIYDTLVDTPETGALVTVRKPVVTLRRSSLVRIPETEESGWVVRIPSSPIEGATFEDYTIEEAPEGCESIGFIRLYLVRIRQAS